MAFKLHRTKQYALLCFILLVAVIILLYRDKDSALRHQSNRAMLTLSNAPQQLLTKFDRSAAQLGMQLFAAERLQEENKRQREELARLKTENDLLLEKVRTNSRLNRLMATSSVAEAPMLPANIIAFSADSFTHTLKIDCGEADGLQPHLAVVGRQGLIGSVAETAEHNALVRQVVDRQFTVSAMIRESRLQGYIKGVGRAGELAFHYDDVFEPLKPGQTVITSGIAGSVESILPKGLVIGKVVRVEEDKAGRAYAVVLPAVDFNRLEEVIVLLPQGDN